MIDVYVYEVTLPTGVHEMVCPCANGGYTVYVDHNDTAESRFRHYRHAIEHIMRGDHEMTDVQEIEAEAHT